MNKRKIVLVLLVLTAVLITQNLFACRMLGIIWLNTPGLVFFPYLEEFRFFGDDRNPNGWAIGHYLRNSYFPSLIFPYVERGGPRAVDDPDYPVAIRQIEQIEQSSLIAHVRLGTSGPDGRYPDPHPFTAPGWMFAHNGTIPAGILLDLIGDPYLETHPVDYEPYLDSELYFKLIMKNIEESPHEEIEEILKRTLIRLNDALTQAGYPSKLTFILSDGTKMWACRYADVNPGYYTLFYSSTGGNNNWIVCSETIVDNDWTPIPMFTIITFRPGYRLRYTPIPRKTSLEEIEAVID
jgi:predicted glutamine amidotransferase